MSRRQLAMVIDLNKCLGCQSCTVACKTMWTNRDGREYMYWNNVETYPGQGYPKNWQKLGGGFDQYGEILEGVTPEIDEDYGMPWDFNFEEIALAKELLSKAKPTYGPNWDEDEGGGEFPKDNYFFYIPRMCNHCDDPACLSSCPRDAIFKRDEDGVVLVDLERCEGHRYCVAGCPYKKVFFNPKVSKSEKCNMCFPLVERGLPPACVSACAGRARFVGFLDDKQSAVYKLVHQFGVALPLLPQTGVKPNVYYIPPFQSPPLFDSEGKIVEGSSRVPQDELEKLFGVEVFQAVRILQDEKKKHQQTQQSELMKILIATKHQEMFRLDANYYQLLARQKGKNPLTPLEKRYKAGKFTNVAFNDEGSS